MRKPFFLLAVLLAPLALTFKSATPQSQDQVIIPCENCQNYWDEYCGWPGRAHAFDGWGGDPMTGPHYPGACEFCGDHGHEPCENFAAASHQAIRNAIEANSDLEPLLKQHEHFARLNELRSAVELLDCQGEVLETISIPVDH